MYNSGLRQRKKPPVTPVKDEEESPEKPYRYGDEKGWKRPCVQCNTLTGLVTDERRFLDRKPMCSMRCYELYNETRDK